VSFSRESDTNLRAKAMVLLDNSAEPPKLFSVVVYGLYGVRQLRCPRRQLPNGNSGQGLDLNTFVLCLEGLGGGVLCRLGVWRQKLDILRLARYPPAMTRTKVWECPHCCRPLPPRSKLRPTVVVTEDEIREDSWLPLVAKALLGRDGPVTVDEVLVAIEVPVTPGFRARAGRILVQLGRIKQRRVVEGARRSRYVSPGWKELAPVKAPPAPLPASPAAPRAPRDVAFFDAVSRWLLDVGDSAVSADEILAGLHIPHTHGNRCRVGRLLVRHLGRCRTPRMINGHACVVYERPPRAG